MRKFISRKTKKNIRTQTGGSDKAPKLREKLREKFRVFRSKFTKAPKAAHVITTPPSRAPLTPMKMENMGLVKEPIRQARVLSTEPKLIPNPIYTSSNRPMTFADRETAYGAQWTKGAQKYIRQVHGANNNEKTKTKKIANILETIKAGKNTEFAGKSTKYDYSKIKELGVSGGLSRENAINLADKIRRVGTSRLLAEAKAKGITGESLSYKPSAYRGYVSPENIALSTRLMSSTPAKKAQAQDQYGYMDVRSLTPSEYGYMDVGASLPSRYGYKTVRPSSEGEYMTLAETGL